MLVSHSNPVVWLDEIVNAMKEGWKIRDSVAGRPSHAFIHEIQLFKGFSIDVERLTSETYAIEEYDSFEFLKKLQNAVLNDFTLEISTIKWDSLGLKSAKLINPHYIKTEIYSKKELEEMEWSTIKKVGRMYGITHRDRNILVTRILEAQEK